MVRINDVVDDACIVRCQIHFDNCSIVGSLGENLGCRPRETNRRYGNVGFGNPDRVSGKIFNVVVTNLPDIYNHLPSNYLH